MKADVKQDMKIRGHKEDAAPDERYPRVDDDPMSQTNFSDSPKSSTPEKTIGDALVDKGAEAPKPRLSPVEMRMLIPATGGLLHAGSTYKTEGAILPPQPLPWMFGETIKGRNIGMTARQEFAKYNRFWHLKVIETIKLKLNLVF